MFLLILNILFLLEYNLECINATSFENKESSFYITVFAIEKYVSNS